MGLLSAFLTDENIMIAVASFSQRLIDEKQKNTDHKKMKADQKKSTVDMSFWCCMESRFILPYRAIVLHTSPDTWNNAKLNLRLAQFGDRISRTDIYGIIYGLHAKGAGIINMFEIFNVYRIITNSMGITTAKDTQSATNGPWARGVTQSMVGKWL